MPPSKTATVSLGDVASRIFDGPGLGGDDAPILSRRKGPERRLAEAKAEEREQAAVAHAKRSLLVTAHEPLKRKVAGVDRKVHAAAPPRATSAADAVRETMLRKVATKGVVALFNAVRGAQKEREAAEGGESKTGRDARPTKRQRRAGGADAANDDAPKPAATDSLGGKDSFLDILRRGTTAKAAASAAKAAGQITSKQDAGAAVRQGASFLRDDFMMGKSRARDWERAVDDEEEDIDEEAERGDEDGMNE